MKGVNGQSKGLLVWVWVHCLFTQHIHWCSNKLTFIPLLSITQTSDSHQLLASYGGTSNMGVCNEFIKPSGQCGFSSNREIRC